MIWVLYFLAAFGLAYIVGFSKITINLRVTLAGETSISSPAVKKPLIPVVTPWLVDLIECPACFGMWIGAAASFYMPAPAALPWWAWLLVLGCATSGANFVVGRLTRLI